MSDRFSKNSYQSTCLQKAVRQNSYKAQDQLKHNRLLSAHIYMYIFTCNQHCIPVYINDCIDYTHRHIYIANKKYAISGNKSKLMRQMYMEQAM